MLNYQRVVVSTQLFFKNLSQAVRQYGLAQLGEILASQAPCLNGANCNLIRASW